MAVRKGSAHVEIDREYAKATMLERLFGAQAAMRERAEGPGVPLNLVAGSERKEDAFDLMMDAARMASKPRTE